MGVSVIGGGILKIMAAKAAAAAKAQEYLMARSESDHKHRVEMASAGTPGFQFTRRLIALGVIGSVIILPKLAAVFAPEIAVTYGWTTTTEGWLWGLFGGDRESAVWHTVNGLVITPLDTHVTMAIAGLYFGASIADARK